MCPNTDPILAAKAIIEKACKESGQGKEEEEKKEGKGKGKEEEKKKKEEAKKPGAKKPDAKKKAPPPKKEEDHKKYPESETVKQAVKIAEKHASDFNGALKGRPGEKGANYKE